MNRLVQGFVGHFLATIFELDSYKKMRVVLAVQVLSQSTITMTKTHCVEEKKDVGQYTGMIELFDKINRLVDICNAYNGNQFTNSKVRRNVNKIDHPKHEHIFELFDILRLVEEWRRECGGFNKRFITRQTYEDLLWVVYGIIGTSSYYLKEDRSLSLDQGRLGSDVMEHFFAMICDNNTNPNLGQANAAASKIGSLNAVVNANQFNGKRAGTNTAGAENDAKALVAKLPGSNYQKRH
jgi:hypothetical protein